MMPVTGNKNSSISVQSVSIRLRSGGLSFFCEDSKRDVEQTLFFQDNTISPYSVESALSRLPQPDFRQLSIYFDTADVLFVPQSILKSQHPALLLQQAAIECPAGHNIIVSEAENSLCALYTLHEDVCRLFGEYGKGGEIHWYSPMHELLIAYRRAHISAECYAVYPTPDNIYIAKFGHDACLQLCEAYPCKNEADAIYIMSELTAGDERRKTKIFVYGDYPVRYTKVLKKYYPHTKTL